jgi:3-methylcrotonyl-CoA carboxylase alpha subunit
MEMNTRLQVEHPVTEMITGLDLVELQLRVAAGERLPFGQDALRASGHAIEARIYAEDPERDFLPATGRLLHLAFPSDARIDTGVRQGDEITAWYDPLIAKLIVHGKDRGAALAALSAALGETHIAGVTTNVEFLRRVCQNRAFADGELDTGLIERHRAELFAARGPVPAAVLVAAALAELEHEERMARERALRSGDPHSPWHRVDGWRLNEASHHDFVFNSAGQDHRVRVAFGDDGRRLYIDEHAYTAAPANAKTVRDGARWHVFHEGLRWTLARKDELADVDVDAGGGSLSAPMPGRVVKLLVKAGARVAKGQPLLILEAMKMEHTITAPADGVVKEIHYGEGEQVLEGAQLLTLE